MFGAGRSNDKSKDSLMTTSFVSRFAPLALVAPLVVLGACAPAPAPLLNPAEARALRIKVQPPVPCSDLKTDLVNTYRGCEAYGGLLDGDKFTKYSVPKDDSHLMTAVDVRCYDLRAERMGAYGVCAPTVSVIAKLDWELPGGPVNPPSGPPPSEPAVDAASNTAGLIGQQASTSVTRDSNGRVTAEATTPNTESRASRQTNSDGTTSVSAGNISATQNRDGSYRDVTFND
jgi:hypothetical protein